jgi:hypothetical protein
MPFDLRASIDGPAFAQQVDTATPHMHTAGVLPDVRPTPLWDAFLAAVWPDPEMRRWAVRVLVDRVHRATPTARCRSCSVRPAAARPR